MRQLRQNFQQTDFSHGQHIVTVRSNYNTCHCASLVQLAALLYLIFVRLCTVITIWRKL